MLITINRIDTKLGILNEIPRSFFTHIEEAQAFSPDLFPDWATVVFSGTRMFKKFRRVYDCYKSIPDKIDRDKIRNAYVFCEDIAAACRDPRKEVLSLFEIHKDIQEEIKLLFNYLYSNSLEYDKFEDHVNDSVRKYILRFIKYNGSLCPFCGLESIVPLNGEARTALDHWLYKEKYPMAAVNMSNLFPIGHKCNSSPAKGSKDVLYNEKGDRDVVFHPYVKHSGVQIYFEFNEIPELEDQTGKWTLKFEYTEADKNYFKSWDHLLNIRERYNSFLEINILSTMWESLYLDFISRTEGLNHSSDLNLFKQNLKCWKASINERIQPGARIYHSFIEYLMTKAPEIYLYQLARNFESNARAINEI